jgi:hypothetical protein
VDVAERSEERPRVRLPFIDMTGRGMTT